MRTVFWFRRDLRIADNPALTRAAQQAVADRREMLALFIADPRLWAAAGAPMLAHLCASLRALRADLGSLHVRSGDPAEVLGRMQAELGPLRVFASDDFGPYGRGRDRQVSLALAADHGELVQFGSPYAVPPGRVRKADGSPYRVYTPFYRAWSAVEVPNPLPAPAQLPVADLTGGEPLPQVDPPPGMELPEAGEAAALACWEKFSHFGLADYHQTRDRPDLPGTSRLSVHLRWGEIHPRTLLAGLGQEPGHETFRKELAWREFYADVLAQRPDTVRANLNPKFDKMQLDTDEQAGAAFQEWALGRTGYPFVDAGMRQLRAEGWMHNRVRMVVASFLVKDLHLPWWWGAEEFMRWLVDGDVASNSHGWQWTAGCGTDAAPYFRIFNPVGQGQRFDPQGDYVRRYIPQLRHLPGARAHTPWDEPTGYRHGYPRRMVDHAEARAEALRRYQALA